MTIGFPTIIIPAVQGGNGGEASKGEFQLTKDEISWLSMYQNYIYFNLKTKFFDRTRNHAVKFVFLMFFIAGVRTPMNYSYAIRDRMKIFIDCFMIMILAIVNCLHEDANDSNHDTNLYRLLSLIT